MIPYRICIKVQVRSGRVSVWKSPEITMVSLDGKISKLRAIGAAMTILDFIAHVKSMPLNKLFRSEIRLKRKKK